MASVLLSGCWNNDVLSVSDDLQGSKQDEGLYYLQKETAFDLTSFDSTFFLSPCVLADLWSPSSPSLGFACACCWQSPPPKLPTRRPPWSARPARLRVDAAAAAVIVQTPHAPAALLPALVNLHAVSMCSWMARVSGWFAPSECDSVCSARVCCCLCVPLFARTTHCIDDAWLCCPSPHLVLHCPPLVFPWSHLGP